MIYCSFCCIYVWPDPGTYMIARFMSFYKPGVTAMSQKKRKKRDRDDSREKTNALRSKPHPSTSIHPSTHSYTCTFWLRIAWLVSPWILSLTLQYMECKYAMFLPYLELHKGFSLVGKTEGRYCPGEDNKSWVPRESHPGNFAMFSKTFQKVSPDGLQIYEQVSMHRSNSQQPKTRR